MSERRPSPELEELLAGLDRLPTPPREETGGKLPVRWSDEESRLLERIGRERGERVKELLRAMVKKTLEDASRALDETPGGPDGDG